MTDHMALLKEAVEAHGQSAVARQIGYSPSAVNQVLKGKYRGNPDGIMQRVAEVYGSGTVECPVLGEIPLSRCADERKKTFAPSSPVRAQLWRACRECGQG